MSSLASRQDGLLPVRVPFFQNIVVLDPTLLARFWIVFCHQALSCYMMQCGTARAGGTISTTGTSHSQRGSFMSSRVNSVLPSAWEPGSCAKFCKPSRGEGLGEGVV